MSALFHAVADVGLWTPASTCTLKDSLVDEISSILCTPSLVGFFHSHDLNQTKQWKFTNLLGNS
jgi:hypothetical protein